MRQPIVRGDVEIFYGLIPSSVLLEHPSDHPERTMHGGAPVVSNAYHLLVSIFDARKKERITDASVSASVSGVGLKSQTKQLETMQMAGVVTYGNYFAIRNSGLIRITLDINQARGIPPIKVTFDYIHR